MLQPYYHPNAPSLLDCRQINLDRKVFGDQDMGHVLDDASMIGCMFVKTGFQGGTARRATFANSRFVHAQMSPFYACEANFDGSVFLKSFFFGGSAAVDLSGARDKMFAGTPTDFTGCSLKRVLADKTDFARCDFTGADLDGAYFEDCRFDDSDLRNASIGTARFVNCNFDGAWISDTPLNRSTLTSGGNKNLDRIIWKA